MVEIRNYRGKSIFNGEWMYGAFLRQYHSSRYGRIDAIFFSDEVKTYRVPVDPETVGQFTGLIDKNGKEIYEGDILHDLNTGAKLPVRYVDGGFWLKPQEGSFNMPSEHLREIIGNVFENPELNIK